MVKRLLIFVLFSAAALSQQSNGRNYGQQKILAGEMAIDSNDSGDANYILTNPTVVPAGYTYSGYGPIHVYILNPDTANNFGVAIYNSSNALLCSTPLAHPTSSTSGWQTFTPTGCGVPVPGATITLAQLTLSSTQEPGDNTGLHTATAECPGTTSFSGYVAGSTFPSTLGTTTAQNFCYSVYVELNVAGGTNGAFYGGGATPVTGIPYGPWNSAGAWYGGTFAAATQVNFSDGLVNATAPTSTTLNNSTHGGACTWSVTNTHGSLTGSSSYTLPPLITPLTVSGTAYSGAGGISLLYTTGTGGDYVSCTLGSSYSSLTIGADYEFDIPATDSGEQYDTLGISSADSTDKVNLTVDFNGVQPTIYAECNNTASGTNGIPVQPSTPYYLMTIKNTGGALNYFYVYNEMTGQLAGSSTCPSASGSHPANLFNTMVAGAETESSGHHIWMKNISVNTSGAQVGP